MNDDLIAEVSVIVPTYRGSAFIADTLASIFAQTRQPSEIIVVDDCSPDDTAAKVEVLARSAPIPLRLIALPRNSGGPSRPLNVGIKAARTDQIILLDQDDLMRPGRIEAQLKTLLAAPQCSIVIGRFCILGYEEDDMSPMWPVPQLHDLAGQLDPNGEYSVIDCEQAFKLLLKRNYAGSCSNFCFTKRWWRKIGKFDETVRTCADLEFMLRAAIAGPVALVNATLFDYRWTKSSLHRRDLTRSLLEATMARLRAASTNPDWSIDEVEALRHSALVLGAASARKGDFVGVKMMAETIARHKGALTLKRTFNHKVRGLANSESD
jgi:glycosyltransferase involved in cell wall biosynthesis